VAVGGCHRGAHRPEQLLALLELELQAPVGEARRSLERLLSFSNDSFAAAARELEAHAGAGGCAGASTFTPRLPSDTTPLAGPGGVGEMLTCCWTVRCQQLPCSSAYGAVSADLRLMCRRTIQKSGARVEEAHECEVMVDDGGKFRVITPQHHPCFLYGDPR
jgi:hypothetical protein